MAGGLARPNGRPEVPAWWPCPPEGIRVQALHAKRNAREESSPMYVAGVGQNGEILSQIDTTNHTLRVPAGEYRLRRFGGVFEMGWVGPDIERVTVHAGQTVEVTLDLLTP
jgi:hypothetical protein